MRERRSDWPGGWESVTIGDVVVSKVQQGAPNTVFIYIDIGSVNNKTKQIESAKEFAEGSKIPSRAQQHVRPGDILVSMTRPNLNAVAKVPTELDGAICSTGFEVLRPIEVEPDWLFLVVKSRLFIEEMASLVQGALYPAVRPADIRAYNFALPPLAEQRRIVAKIEALQKRSRRAREALAEVELLLEQFRQSVLAAAFRGDLTADWRAVHPSVEPASGLLHRIRTERRHRWEQAELAKYEAKGQKPPKKWQDKYEEPEPVDDTNLPALPADWAWVAMEDLALFESNAICAGPFGTIFKAKDFRSEGVPIIFLRHVSPGKYLTNKPGFMDRKKWEELFQPYSVYGGELLVTKLGEPPGTSAIYPETIGVAMVTPDVMKMSVNPKAASNRFLMYYLNSEVARRFTFGIAYGATRPRMNLTIFRRMPVPLAPFEEQQELALRIDGYFSTVDQVGESIPTNLSMLDQIDQSILAKAFRGELVPQEPNDEPASVLLARLREQKAQQTEAAKGKKQTANIQRRDEMEKKSSGLSSQHRPLVEVLTTKGRPMPPQQLLTEAGYDDDSIEDFYWALREEIAKGHIRENKLTESDVMVEAVKP